MKIYRAYKFRMYPNIAQKELINQTLGCTRSIYNYYLNKKKETYEQQRINIPIKDCIKDLPNLYIDRPYLKEIDSMSLRTTLFDLYNAYQKFYKEKKGYPKYKSKYQKNSYRTNCIRSNYKGTTYENIKVDMLDHTITLPKLKDIKIKGYRKAKEIQGRIISATITKESNRYYVSIIYEQEIKEQKTIPKTIIGIDLGIKDLIITSEGEKIRNEKAILKYENKIKGLQKGLSKKKPGSKNYYKMKQKIQAVYRKLKNTRKNSIHAITKRLTDENDIIVTEKLQLQKLIQEKKYSKYLTDASLNEIIRQITYKSKWKNKQYYQVATYYPSSQICHCCGYKNKIVKDVGIRTYECESCRNKLDRDINAAINLMDKGLEYYLKEQYNIKEQTC